MDLGLEGLKALVTGGTRGIGRAIVDRLAAEGCAIALCARNGDEVQAAVGALEADGAKATGAAVDVADGPALKAWVDAAAQALGGIDIVVANVSGMGSTLGDEGWRRGFEIDIMGTVHTVEAAMPCLEKSEAASIVAISSTAALESFGGVRPYNSVKAAVVNYMSSLSSALAGNGVRANTVSPGTIYFEDGVWGQRKREQPEIFEWALSRNPTGRMGRPDEVANATVFLASPAASFISGANLVVDGAMTTRVQF
ncbi:MAG: SDR family oxidoreductase [Alphaproteobacteria bacterium]|jgi:3-oxoacyl-[acyl-carrier protein] reductase|nr:SDR family oxidoreductase [Alphaproteobacteria bacterium]